jgi:hypothetical protein
VIEVSLKVDGIEVAHQLERDKLQYDICQNLVLGSDRHNN